MVCCSDGTLNPNGVRFGSSEIYNVVESFSDVQDSLCVAQRSRDLAEERVILFLKMAPGEVTCVSVYSVTVTVDYSLVLSDAVRIYSSLNIFIYSRVLYGKFN